MVDEFLPSDLLAPAGIVRLGADPKPTVGILERRRRLAGVEGERRRPHGDVENPATGLRGRRYMGGVPAAYGALAALREAGRMTQAEFMEEHCRQGAARLSSGRAGSFSNNFSRYVRNELWPVHAAAQRAKIDDELQNIPAFGKTLLPKEQLRRVIAATERQDLVACIVRIRPPGIDWRRHRELLKRDWCALHPEDIDKHELNGSNRAEYWRLYRRLIRACRHPDTRNLIDVAPRGGNMLVWAGVGSVGRAKFDAERIARANQAAQKMQKHAVLHPSLAGTADEWMLDSPHNEV